MDQSRLKNYNPSTLQDNWYEDRLQPERDNLLGEHTMTRPYEADLPVHRIKRTEPPITTPIPVDGHFLMHTTTSSHRGESAHVPKPKHIPLVNEENISEVYVDRAAAQKESEFNATIPRHKEDHDRRYVETTYNVTHTRHLGSSTTGSSANAKQTARESPLPFSSDLEKTYAAHEASKTSGHGRRTHITYSHQDTARKDIGKFLE